MKHPENEKMKISLTGEQLPVFWLRSLRFSIHPAIDVKKDLSTLKLSAQIFLTLRDFGVTGILFVFIYDFVRILKSKDRNGFSRFYDENSIKFSDAVDSETYKYDCISTFKNSQRYQKLKKLFTADNNEVYKFAIFFEQLFESFSLHSSFYFFAPEYDLSSFENTVTRFFNAVENNGLSCVLASEDLEFSTSLEDLFNETVEFLKKRLSANEKSYQLSTEKLDEIKNAHLFIKKSVRMQKRLIEQISQSLQTISIEEMKPVEQTQDFIESDDAFYYPRGGINELTRKGSFETILPSELAFIDEKIDEDEKSPDLFTLRYAENEILYFQRDDGYIRRKHYSVNIVLWDFLSFRTFAPGLEHTLDVYLESALLRFIKDFIKFVDAKGLMLRIHWLYKATDQTVETPELFRQMFNSCETLGIIENSNADNVDELKNIVNTSTKDEYWFFILPATSEKLQFPDFSSFYTELLEKSKIHVIQFEDNTKLSDIEKNNDFVNNYMIEIPSKSEIENPLQPFENLVNLLLKLIA